jgi:transposase
MGDTLSPQLRVALAPLLSALETITARIREYDAQIEKLAEESYPDVALLKQVKGVGTLIALTYKRRVPATAPLAWPPLHHTVEREGVQQMAAPTVPRTPNVHRAHKSLTTSADGRVTTA